MSKLYKAAVLKTRLLKIATRKPCYVNVDFIGNIPRCSFISKQKNNLNRFEK